MISGCKIYIISRWKTIRLWNCWENPKSMHKSILQQRVALGKQVNESSETLQIAYQCWDKLKTLKLLNLREDFENMWMKDSDLI